jgi:nicotianamine synthase
MTPITTKITIDTEVCQITDEIITLVNALASLPDLKPCPDVNKLFGRLVSLCIKPYSSRLACLVLHNKQIQILVPRLRQICSEGEGELERFWARKILHECHSHEGPGSGLMKNVHEVLRRFPYYTNYKDLCCLELSNILAVLPQHDNTPAAIAFIGSGPLPFTSFIMADFLPSVTIHNIDIDPTAISLGSALTDLLDYDERLTFQMECASSPGSLKAFDIVYLAALVGASVTEKTTFMESVASRMRKDALLVVRSAAGLRALLYPVVEYDDLGLIGLEMVVEVRPWNHIVNSTMIMKVL